MSFWDVPGMKAGVVTGDVAWGLYKHAKENGYAIPAFNCTSTSTINAVLEAGRKMNRPVQIQFSEGGAAFFVGKGLPNDKGVLQASILGAVAGAHYVRHVAPAYGIPVITNTDHCAKKLLPWMDGMLEADECFFKAHGEPLFSAHMLDLSEESDAENLATCKKYLTRMKAINQILEMEIGVTGGVEDGVDNSNVANDKLYSTPEDVYAVYQALSPISEKFMIAAAFGNVHGVYKPGNVKLRPELLDAFQKYTESKVPGSKNPLFFVFHGGSGSEKHEIATAVKSGVVKMNVDTDTQWAYWEGLLKFYKAKEGYLQGQIGNPEGQDKPNKSYYDPRKWVRESETSMAKRVEESMADLNNKNGPSSSSAATPKKGGLPADKCAELKTNAAKLCTPGKGFLAADESAGPWLRAGHAEAAKIPDTIENRAAYRSMCFATPGLCQHISGVILHWETLFQNDAAGKPMVDIITGNGMLAGIKLDKAYNKKGIWGTEVGPLGHPEVSTVGLDDLQQRCKQAYEKGARFAKWRNVLQLDPAKGLPSDLAIKDTVHTLARYASICQSEGLVPIVEPEIVPNGKHDIYYCAKMTEKVLAAQFKALADHHVYLEGAVLKPNMVKNGIDGPRADHETVATLTCQTLLRTVPKEMPGIFFLSGETPLDEDNEEVATINLSTMNKLFKGKLPWTLSFSYGKALQKTCIVTWLGKDENRAAAQKALKARANANSDAVRGTYVPGSCASIGTDGNVKQAAGPY